MAFKYNLQRDEFFFNYKIKKRQIMKDKFTLSTDDKWIAGVCGGLGEYFKIDSTLLRLLWISLTFTTFPSVIIYFLIAILAPKMK